MAVHSREYAKPETTRSRWGYTGVGQSAQKKAPEESAEQLAVTRAVLWEAWFCLEKLVRVSCSRRDYVKFELALERARHVLSKASIPR